MSNEHITDEQIREALEAEFLCEPGKRNWDDDLQVARATLALRSAVQPTITIDPTGEYGAIYQVASSIIDGYPWTWRDVHGKEYLKTDPTLRRILWTAPVPASQTWDANQIAMACAQAEISDGHCQSLLIALEESNKG